MYEIDLKAMGEKIREKRLKKKLCQEKLGEKVGIGPTHMGQIERGEKGCSLVVLVNIADELELNLETLIRGTDRETKEAKLLEIMDRLPEEKQPELIKICEEKVEEFLK